MDGYIDALPALWWLGPVSVFLMIWAFLTARLSWGGFMLGWMPAAAVAWFGVMLWGELWPLPTFVFGVFLLRGIVALLRQPGRYPSQSIR